MRIDIVTIFPEFFSVLDVSLVGKARTSGLLRLAVHNLRDFTHDRHRTVDDTPYGGGAGMVMRPEPWGEALDAVLEPGADAVGTAEPDGTEPGASESGGSMPGGSESGASIVASGPVDSGSASVDESSDEALPVVIFPSPAGQLFSQSIARELAQERHLVFACGRYEGIDQRVVEHTASRARVRELSLGDYVLNGGEVAAMAMIEAIGRLVPGVVGNPESLSEESHENGLLEYPSYTKPAEWRGFPVPPILLSGNHGAIARWRHEQQVERTRRVRPELLD